MGVLTPRRKDVREDGLWTWGSRMDQQGRSRLRDVSETVGGTNETTVGTDSRKDHRTFVKHRESCRSRTGILGLLSRDPGQGFGVPTSCIESSRFYSRHRPWVRSLLGSESLVTLPTLNPRTRPYPRPIRSETSRPNPFHTGQTVGVEDRLPRDFGPCGFFPLRPSRLLPSSEGFWTLV